MLETRPHHGQLPSFEKQTWINTNKEGNKCTLNEMKASEFEEDSGNEEAIDCFMAMKENKDEDRDHEVNTKTSPLMIYFALSKKCIKACKNF